MKKVLFIILLIFIIYLAMPHIITDKNKVYLNVHEKLIVPNYKVKIFLLNTNKKTVITENVDSDKLGTYYINYKYGIINHLVLVKVVDKTHPYIEFCGPKNINLFDNTDFLNYKVHDNYDTNINVKVKKYKDKYVYILKDKSGNKSIVERKITNEDTLAPLIVAPSNIFINEGEGLNSNFYAIDNSKEKIKVEEKNIDLGVGRHILVLKAKDSKGNVSEKKVNINVLKKLKKGYIYLTFDDGPGDLTTPTVLDTLKERGIHATFFVTGNGSDSLIKREYDEGNSIGLHTMSHIYSNVYKDPKSYFNDLYAVRNRVYNITGMKSDIIRFPGGSSNTISKHYKLGIMSYLTKEVEDRGFRYYDWNINSGDAEGKSKEKIYNIVTSKLSHNRPNIVLFHDTKKNTMEILPSILDYAISNGYKFDTIKENDAEVKQRIFN